MGGKALLETKTRRYLAAEFVALAADVKSKLAQVLPDCRIEVVPYYRNKESFGDLDLLVEDNNALERVLNNLDQLGVTELVRPKSKSENFNPETQTWSLGGFGELQVDLIFMPSEHFDSALSYYSYNDLGNFVGRTADSMGFAYGHKGLTYTLMDPDNSAVRIEKMVVSSDTKAVLEFLGFDYERFAKGFDTLEEVIDYAMSTPYLQPNFFNTENRNHRARSRDNKRDSYKQMWKTLVEKGVQVDVDSLPTPQEQLTRAFKVFPEFGERYKRLLADHAAMREVRDAERKRVKARYSAEKVREWTGTAGKSLGVFMGYMREVAQSTVGMPVSEYVASLSDDQVKEWVLTCHQNWQS
ncbi:MAG: hypothetical protein GY833_12110 [Aestuariibacter sp.]|nr:hypothetical protein [Aestuariibacter sp.]|tara:strand:+ start:13483 stop:14547 length:1065 start_codon:yes stop_codon:yes gene_type:complete